MSSASLLWILCCVLAASTAQLLLPGAGRSGAGNSNVGLALVANGRDTPAEEVPYHAGIYGREGNRLEILCGGTLIATNLVITAAHCFWAKHPNINAADYVVRLGSTYSAWHLDAFNPSVQRVAVKNITLHPRYRDRERNFEYDVALMLLKENVNLTQFVQVAYLDYERSLNNVLAAKAEGVVAGWGWTVNSTGASAVLQSISLPYIDEDSCYDATPQEARFLITRGKFCAGYRDSQMSVCPGDSGGGYIVKGSGNKAFVIGIVSTNLQTQEQFTCFSDHYTTFINLRDELFLRWIRDHLPVDAPCSLGNKGSGVCRRIEDCPNARNVLESTSKETPVVCYYDEAVPIVCCDPNVAPPRAGKSWEKCLEYASPVYRTVPPKEAGASATVVDQCFLRSHHRQKRIIGGNKSRPKEFPHMASLGFNDGDNVTWLSAGSLISPRFVLTTSTSVFSIRDGGFVRWIRLGDMNLDETYDDSNAATYAVEKVIPHPNYTNPAYYDDIALVKLSQDVVFNAHVRPACLNTIADTPQGQTATATGWGITSTLNYNRNSDLMKVDLIYKDPQLCNTTFAPLSRTRKLTRGYTDETMICAGDTEGNRDTCQGDSGGPLQTLLDRPYYCMYSVVGLLSFGSATCGQNYPSVYTRVSHYVPWIESVVWP